LIRKKNRCVFVNADLRKLPLTAPRTRHQGKGKAPPPRPTAGALFDAINAAPFVPTAGPAAGPMAAEPPPATSPAAAAAAAVPASDSASAFEGAAPAAAGGALGLCSGRVAIVHGHRFLDRTLLLHVSGLVGGMC
jgi:hypothetical protein